MEKIGIFFGPLKGSVNKVASIIANELGSNGTELIPVKGVNASDIERFSKIILGISSIGRDNWDAQHNDTDWDLFLTHIESINWKGKTVAIFGLGNQVSYADNFVDSMGWLYERLAKLDANIVGSTSTTGYRFNGSDAVKNNKFVGLAIDEDNEQELTLSRVKNWIEDLKKSGF
jgi:flavodoxin I